MKNNERTKEQFINEIGKLNQKIAKLEKYDIKHKKVEEELRFHSEIMKNMAEGVYLVGLDDVIIKYTNPKFEKMFGYKKGEMIGKHASIVNAPTDKDPRETAKEIMKTIYDVGEWNGEVNNIKKDGTTFWCSANVSRFNHSDFGEVLIAVHSDKTESKQVEQSLHESEKQYRTLVESTRDGVLITNSEGKFLFVNSSYASMLGYSSADELIGTSAIDRYANPNERAELFKRLSKDGFVEGMEIEVLKKDGTSVIVLFSIVTKKDESGEIIQAEAFVSDITERKKAEEEIHKYRNHLEELVEERTKELEEQVAKLDNTVRAFAGREAKINELQENEEKYKAVLETAPAYITAVDNKFDIIDINYVVPGLLKEEVVGKQVYNFVDPDYHKALKRSLDSVFKTKNVERFESKALGPNNSVAWYENRVGPILRNDKVVAVTIIGVDITNRKQVEEKLKKSEQKHQRLFNTMEQGVVYQDADGQIISANPSAERILGLSLDQMQGRTSIDPQWKSIHEDGSDFPGEAHPAIVSLEKGKAVKNVVMGVFNPIINKYCWININAVPQVKEGEKIPYQVYTTFDDITERNQAEEELRLTQFSVDNSTDAVYWMGPDANFVYVNNAAVEELGYSKAELLSMTVHDIGPDFPKEVWPAHWAELKEKKSFIIQTIHQRKDRSTFPVEITVNFIKFGDQEINCAIAQNITERKQSENKLKESEKRFIALMQQSPSVIELYNLEGLQIYVNAAYEILWGFPASRTLNKFNILKSKEVKDTGLIKYITQAYNGKTVTVPEYEFDPKGKTEAVGAGRNRWLSTRIYPLKDSDEKISNIVITHEDITDRKDAQNKLIESEEKFRNITEQITEMVFLTDDKGILKYISPASKTVFGLNPIEMEDRLFMKYLKKTDIPKAMKKFLHTLTSGKRTVNMELNMMHGNGNIFIGELTARRVKNKNIRGTLGIIRDITERKKIEKELLKHRDNLEILVKERTKELDEKNEELDLNLKMFVGREQRILNLEREIKELKRK